MAFPLLSVIVFLPLLGAMVLAGVPREHVNALRWGALVVMLLQAPRKAMGERNVVRSTSGRLMPSIPR